MKTRWKILITILIIVILAISLFLLLQKSDSNKNNIIDIEKRIVSNKYPIPFYLSVLYPMVNDKFWIDMSDKDLISTYLSLNWFYLPLVYPLQDDWYDYDKQIGTWKNGLNISPNSKYLYFPSLGYDLGDYGIALSGNLRGKSVFGCSVFGAKGSWHSEWHKDDGGLTYNNLSFIQPWGFQRTGVPNYSYIETQTYVCEEIGRAFMNAPDCGNMPPMIQTIINDYCTSNKCFKTPAVIDGCNPKMYLCPPGAKVITGDTPLEQYESFTPQTCVSPPNLDCILKTNDWEKPDPSCKNKDGTTWTPDQCPPGSLAYADDTIQTCLDFTTGKEGTQYGKPYCSNSRGASAIGYCDYSVSDKGYIQGNTCATPQALWNCDTSNGCVFAINENNKWTPWPAYLANQKYLKNKYDVQKVFQTLIFSSKPINSKICDGWWTKCGYVTPTATYEANCDKLADSVNCPNDNKPPANIISPNGSLEKPGKFMAYWMKGYGKFCNMGKTAVYYSFVHMLLTCPKTFPTNGPAGNKLAGAHVRWDPIQVLAGQGNRQYINQLVALSSGEYHDPRQYIQGFVSMFRKGKNNGILEELPGGQNLPNKLPFKTENVNGMLNPLDDPFLQELDKLTVGKFYPKKIKNPNYGKRVKLSPYNAAMLFFAMNINGDTGGDCPGDLLNSKKPGYCTKGSVAIGKQPLPSKTYPYINGNGYYPFGLYFPGSNIGSACYAIGYNLGWDSIQLTQMPTGAGRGAYCTTSMQDYELVFLRGVEETCKNWYFTADVSKDWDRYKKYGYVQGSSTTDSYEQNVNADKQSGLIKNVTPKIMPLTERNMPDGGSPNTWFYPTTEPPVKARFECPYRDQIVSKNKKHGNY